MEETATVIPQPPPATSNHVTDAKTIANSSSKLREEGELSASENDDFASSRLPVGTIRTGAPLNKGTSVIEKGVSVLIHNPAVASRTTVHPNKRKGTEKNRVPFVISFSDDDSGSDSEEYKTRSTMESDEMTRGAVENRKLPVSVVSSQSQMVQQSAKTNSKSPKKLSTSRTFASSVNRVNAANFKNGGSTIVGGKSQLKKSNSPSILKFGQNIHVNSNKLQDLRQLIAIRENELKSKAGKHEKEVASSSKKNSPDMNLNSLAVKSRNLTERVVVEPNEPEKKRLKVNEPPRNVVVSVGQRDRLPLESTVAAGAAISAGRHDRPPSESTVATGFAISVGQHDRPPSESAAATADAIPAGQHDRPPSESTAAAAGVKIYAGQHETSAPENDGLKGRYDGNYCDKKILLGGPGQSSTIQHRIKEVKSRTSKNLPSGGGIISNSRQPNRITNLGESSAQLMAKTDKSSPPRQGCLMNSSFWSHFGATTGEMDMKSLMELEELQDKELDEAQEHRRKCEIEERNALKAYRKAQRDLAEANARCSYLYHKRNLFSANLRSHVMEESNMFWSNMPLQHTDANVNSVTNMSENDIPLHQVHNECGEPDTSGSEPEEEGKTNNVGSSLHENNSNNILAEDEQTSAFGLKAGESSLDSHVERICSERHNEINNDSAIIGTNEDSLLLEATLRSQLFARLGNRNSKKNESGQRMETTTVEREDGGIMEDSGNILCSETEKDQIYDIGDTMMSDKSISEQPESMKDQCDVEKYPVDYGSFFAEPVLKSAFCHVKVTAIVNSMQSHNQNTQISTDDIIGEKEIVNDACGAQPTDSASNSVVDLYVGEVGSYSNNLPINPFWPLCMFELRGKCNDDECPWQHVRDYSSKNIDSNSNDRGSLCLAPPTYLVCLDSLKADSHPYKYLVAPTIEQRWKKSFSAFLVASSSILADLNSDERYLHGPETRIEVHGVWNRQSSYFHGQNAKEGLTDEHMDGIYQRIETAFHNLSRDVSKQKGRSECLIVLARALEEHPTSVILWIVYLLIFYSNQKSIGKDDMFRYAIEHNDSSYELWLMFINSREKLDDRLLGYNTAISALCRHVSTPNRDSELDSECIIDLFLQMINCVCSSGEVNNAIQEVYGLLSSTNTPTDLHAPSMPDIRKCLTVPNRCVLWLCSMYLLMYKKLPDTIIQQFECPKDLSTIEWHSVQLTNDERHQALTLLECAPEYIDSKRSAQWFALSHIRCTAILKGFDSCKDLLEKYLRLYPSCLELILLSIRVNGFGSSESTFTAFEEALSNWVGGHGIQCIWNQYAGYALETGKVEFAKGIMERWSHSISDTCNPKPGNLSMSALMSSLTETELIFGLLNLSLYKQLQNDHKEARFAIEQAFEVASSDDYNYCVREHAMLFLKKDFGFGNAHLDAFLSMMNRYLMDSRASQSPDLLSRSFIESIGNPKIKKIVNSLLCPVSSDSSMLNLVLELCFGSSLLPFESSEKPTDAIDLAEALMEMRPANYSLALSICKNQSDANASISFWASAQLIDSLFQAVPIAPESVWVEAAGLLKNVVVFRSILESFHKRALSLYPFSLRLWKSYCGLYDMDNTNQANAVAEMAKEKGIKL